MVAKAAVISLRIQSTYARPGDLICFGPREGGFENEKAGAYLGHKSVRALTPLSLICSHGIG